MNERADVTSNSLPAEGLARTAVTLFLIMIFSLPLRLIACCSSFPGGFFPHEHQSAPARLSVFLTLPVLMSIQ